jgi:rRNA maturation RNase YbeY
MSSKSKVYFFFDKVNITLRRRTQLKTSIEKLFRKEGKALLLLNYVFCNDVKLRAINRQFLNHDYFTDIITFNLSQSKSEIIGEVYISVTRVRENALLHKTSLSAELLRVIYHGALHLCGYDDKSAKEKAEIRKMENLLIKKFT